MITGLGWPFIKEGLLALHCLVRPGGQQTG
jgi:hypothetical protein